MPNFSGGQEVDKKI